MTEKDQSDSTLRRTFMKGAAATGVAATGFGALSGSAAGQQGTRQLNVRDLQISEGLLSITVQNINVLRNVDDIVVTIIGGDVSEVVTVDVEDSVIFEERLINVDINVDIEDVLNENVVQVIVTALSDGDVVTTGDIVDN